MKIPWMPPLQSAQGGAVDKTILIVHLLMLAIFLGWGIYYVAALVRSRRFDAGRRKPGQTDSEEVPAADGSDAARRPTPAAAPAPRSWLPWVLAGSVGLIELILLFGLEMPLWNRLRVQPPAGPDVIQIRIVAEQFTWNVHYPGPDGLFGRADRALVSQANPIGLDRSDSAAVDDIVAINQLHLPVGRPVVIDLSSKDVIHSFFLPVMRVKQDIIPGQMSRVWFTPTQAGVSEIACAQLCGLGHYRMKGLLTVHEVGGYERWVLENRGK